MGDLPRKKWWSHCDGWPTRVEKERVVSFLWVTYPGGRMASLLWVTYPSKKKMENGLILMGDLPRNKMMVSLWWVTYPEKNDGLIMMGDLPKWKRKEWSHSYGWPTQGEEWPHYYAWPTQVKMMENGLILMGDLPRNKMMVSLWWVTYPEKNDGLIMMGDLPKWKRKEWSHSYGWPT